MGGLASANFASPMQSNMSKQGVPTVPQFQVLTLLRHNYSRDLMLYYKSPSLTHTFNFRVLFQSVHLDVVFITSWHRLWFAFFKLTSSLFLLSQLSVSPANLCGLVHGGVVSGEDIQCTEKEIGMLWPLGLYWPLC